MGTKLNILSAAISAIDVNMDEVRFEGFDSKELFRLAALAKRLRYISDYAAAHLEVEIAS